MIGKLCAGPKSGGSAGGLSEYLVGYSIAGKGASKDEIAAALDAVYLEAELRDDLGVGRLWSPEAGHGTRPSSILVRNCSSFSTASMEMDGDASLNPGVKHAAMHFVWSFSTKESGYLTDEQVTQYAREVTEKLGLSDHRMELVVHRDTLVRDAAGKVIDGNLHVHAAIGSVNPRTLMAYDRTGIYKRMAKAEREVEQVHRLDPDRGLYVFRNHGKADEKIEEATREELAAWARQRREERLVAMERRNAEGYRQRDTTFARYCDATVAPRMRAAMDTARQASREPDWGTLHAVAGRYGCEIQQDKTGRIILRDVGIGELRLAHEKERRSLRRSMTDSGAGHDEIDAALALKKSEHEKEEAEERHRKREEGDIVGLDAVLNDDRSDMPEFQTEEEAERAAIEMIEARPEIVLDELTAQSSTFTRDDIDAWIGKGIANPLELERVGDLVVGHESVRALSADTRYPLLTTTEILEVEGHLHADAAELASRPSGFSAQEIDAAMAVYEKTQSTVERPFRLSDEQREALHLLEAGSLVAIEGLPGVGKTTIMSAVRELAEAQGKEIVGLTLSQAAAERLEDEAKFTCVNTARARMMEQGGEAVIPSNGIVVVDEAGMVDSRAMARILALAKERGSVVLAIGDTRQLQPIDAGASFRIVRDLARDADAYTELRDVQRQRQAWHREAVVLMADAIVEKDDARRLDLVRRSLTILDEHKAITWCATRDDAIDHAVSSARTLRAAGFRDTLLLAADKDTTRHLAEQDRREEGLEGAGRTYVTTGGRREFAAGDRLVFLENSLKGRRALGVRNGDTGTVVVTEANRLSVRLDREDRVVDFSTRRYKAFDHGAALTVHKSQGASVDGGVAVLDRSASAELAFVALSRSKHALDLVVAQTVFEDLADLSRHISDRISIKTTTRNWDEILDRTGESKDRKPGEPARTDRVRNIEAQREAESSSLRQRWQAEVVEPLRALRRERMRESRADYQRERGVVGVGDSLIVRLERQRELLREFRARAATITAQTSPPKYKDWLKELETAQERAREAQRGREKRRELERLTEGRGSGIDRDRSRQSRRDGPEMELDGQEHER